MPDHKSSRSSTTSDRNAVEHLRDGLASGQPAPNVKNDPPKPPEKPGDSGSGTRRPHSGGDDRARPVRTPHGALHSVNGPLRGDDDPPPPPPPDATSGTRGPRPR